MKKITQLILILLSINISNAVAQVTTNFNNENLISSRGTFSKNYATSIDFTVPAKNIEALLEKETQDKLKSNETKPFRLAEPVAIDLDIAKQIKWTYDSEFAYGKYTITQTGALSSSINFDQFYLPNGSQLFVYNENGSMITGPVTEKENNVNKIWGSWVYKGNTINIEIKTPKTSLNSLVLHANNIAYGYKEIYKSVKVGGYGTSGPCNINVICPLGNGWEGERNSVSTILNSSGDEFCTGSLIMNTCGTNAPFYLTANHCFDGNAAGWRFAFQAWSTTCPNPGVNTTGVIYNGSTLRARNAASDFCLVELNTTPPTNSGLHYAGWNRGAAPALNATGIHHPSGDLMKISRANNPVTISSYAGTTNQHWRANWSPQNNGAGATVTAITEPGSSGSPLFDQDHRIIGQLHGGPSACNVANLWDYYGRFDLSWTGGGTNSTRLSNWLDPQNTGVITTNTANISSLIKANLASYSIVGVNQFCTSANYSISNLPIGATVQWYLTNSFTTNSVSSNVLTLNRVSDGNDVINAIVTICGFTPFTIQKNIRVGGAPILINSNQTDCDQVTFTVNGAAPTAIYNWSSDLNTILYNGTSTTATTSSNTIAATASSYDYPIVNTTNTCNQSVGISGIYNPYERNIQGLYPEYASCGEHVSVSVNTTQYDTYYRWYINDILVKEGTNAYSYCTCYNEGPYARQSGNNTIRVEVETNCNASSTGYGEFFWMCGYYRYANVDVFPNPAKDQVNIKLKQLDSKINPKSLKEIREVIVFDKLGNIKGRYKYPSQTKAITLSVTNLITDIYFLEITDGKNKSRIQLSVEK
ncbi:MAG: trypsin-like peptidase domain-containing protein [Ferruginibacter sp.]